MAQKPLAPFKGTVPASKKVCVIENGVIVRMYWEHPGGNEDFDHEEIVAEWQQAHLGQPPLYFTTPAWLSSRGFYPRNVIRDGARVPS